MLPVRDDIEDIPGVRAGDNGGGYLLRGVALGVHRGSMPDRGCSLLCLEGGIDRIEREDGGEIERFITREVEYAYRTDRR